MSDQSLRDALESRAKAWKHERGDLYYASQELMGMLAAHPAEPASADREALEEVMDREICTCQSCEEESGYNEGARAVRKAVLALLNGEVTS